MTASAMALTACDRDGPAVEQTALSSSGPPKTAERPLPPGSFNSNWLTHGRTFGEQRFSPGEFAAYAADSGERLWAFPAQTGVTAGPVTYAIDGEQYVSVAVGWGTITGILGGPAVAPLQMKNRSRVLTFRLGGSAQLPVLPDPVPIPLPDVPEQRASDNTVLEGHRVFAQRCLVCHGFSAVSGGLVSDLRYSDRQVYAQWDAIVLGGSLSSNGMPPFAGVVTPAQSQAIKAYIIDRAHALLSGMD